MMMMMMMMIIIIIIIIKPVFFADNKIGLEGDIKFKNSKKNQTKE